MRKITFLLLLLAAAASAEASEPGAVVALKGQVIRENGSPVAGARITAVERAPWSPVGLLRDYKVARTTSDAAGRFEIRLPRATRMGRLVLVASGEWKRIKTKDGHDGLFGTSVPLRKITKTGTNRIVVPNDFRPVRAD